MTAAWAVAAGHGRSVDPAAPSPAAAVAEALAARGLSSDASDVVWVDGPAGVAGAIAGGARALVRAGPRDGPRDVYLVRASLSPEGSVLAIDDVWDLTDTSEADESRPVVRGSRAAYTTSVDGVVTGVHVLDLAGAAPDADAGFTWLQRAQAAVTNLQQTGQTAGVEHSAFVLDPVAPDAALAWRGDGRLEIRANGRLVLVDPPRARVLEGADLVRVVPDERARPGNLVTWAVDRVRAAPWFGDEKMQWVKAIAFTLLDAARTAFSRGTTAADVRDELGLEGIGDGPPSAAPTFADPEVGWPPPPVDVPFSTPLPGEGKWIPLDHDPFITPGPDGEPVPFVTSFVRPDPRRPDVRVYVTLWDPRRIALHMESGTVEPISATGAHGTGLIPRTPEVMKRVVAAFDGGFQAQHGEYGMRADGVDYLPPKPYAATVVELRDGSNGFGAWPESTTVPGDVVSLRQNLTALVQDGRYNPWGRTWWGGAPPGWPDQIHTTRSAICLTRDGFVGYFYSASVSAEDLAQGMLLGRCAFGIHLDMNPGHAGFEFYDVAEDEGQLAPLARPLQADWEAEGKVPDMPGYVFRARRMIRAMGHMLFPRYIHREARDFFYLTARSVLPGAAVTDASAAARPDPDEGLWRTRGLPQHGFPFAIAITRVRSDAGRPDLALRIIRADPRALAPSTGDGDRDATVLSLIAPPLGPSTLWISDGDFAIAPAPPSRGAVALAAGYSASDVQARTARAAACVDGEDGMLWWVELPPDIQADASTAAAMDGLLTKLGCGVRVLLPGGSRALLGGALDAAGDPISPARAQGSCVRLVRRAAPDAHAVFTDTPVVPMTVWQPLQTKGR